MATVSAAVASESERLQHSQLLASLLKRRDGQRLTVLDVGSASPETVNFFSGTHCRLVFADFLSEAGLPGPKGLGASYLLKQFEAVKALAGGSRFDVCLFWDLFNFLDDGALGVFAQALRPMLHDRSRAHGLGLQQGVRHLTPQTYAIHDSSALVVRAPMREAERPCFAHPPALLPQVLPMFPVARAVLLSNGRLEYSLGAANAG